MKPLATLILTLMMVSLLSCTRQNPAYNRENIKATWMMDQYEREDIPLEERMVYAFDREDGLVLSGITNMGEDNYKWASSVKLYYKVFCCSLDIEGSLNGFYDIPAGFRIKQSYEIVSQRDSVLRIRPTVYQINGEEVVPPSPEISMSKLSPVFEKADSLYGMWNYEGSAFRPFRLEFGSNNVLKFFVPSAETQQWEQVSQKDYYNKYDDFLALTFFDNPVVGREGKWSVSVVDIVSAGKAGLVLLYGQNELHFTKVEKGND